MRVLSGTHPNRLLMEQEEEYRRFLDEKDLRKSHPAIAAKEALFGPDGLSAKEKEILAAGEKRTCGNCRYSATGRFSLYCYEMHDPRDVRPGDPACEWFGRRG